MKIILQLADSFLSSGYCFFDNVVDGYDPEEFIIIKNRQVTNVFFTSTASFDGIGRSNSWKIW